MGAEPRGPFRWASACGRGGHGERWLELSEQERQAEAARFQSPSPLSPILPPAASCTQDLGLHQEPSPHGLSHSKHLSFSLPGWHLPPCSHCTNPPFLDSLEPPVPPIPGPGRLTYHRVEMVPLRPGLAGAHMADGVVTKSPLLPFVLQEKVFL